VCVCVCVCLCPSFSLSLCVCEQVPADFFSPSYVPGPEWFSVNVPGNWELQGFDIPRYRNIFYTFSPVDPPNVPHDDNPTGCYRIQFTLPTMWANRPVLIQVRSRTARTYAHTNKANAHVRPRPLLAADETTVTAWRG
jgi:hypothetical protein